MYWIIFSVLVLVILLCLLGFIITLKEDREDAGSVFFVGSIFGLILWMFIELKTYHEVHTKDLKPSEVSILSDKEIAIIRYQGFQKTYDKKKEYDAIMDSSFVLSQTTEYDILGEENDFTYELKIK